MRSRITGFFVLSLLCAAIAFGVLLPGLGGGFIFDDLPNIVTNNAVHLVAFDIQSLLYAAYSFQPGEGSRFLPMLSFALDHWRGGLDPAVFKATNLFIHALTVVALAFFLRTLLLSVGWSPERAARVALVLALLWGLHPLQVSAVLYVVQRMQTMVTLFLVLAMWAYLMARQAQIEGRPSRPAWLAMVLCWGLAFASKEDGILLPAYTLVLEVTVLRFRAQRATLEMALRRAYLLMFVAGLLAYLLVVVPHYWRWDAYPSRDFSSYERLLTQGRVLVMYLGQILLPLPDRLPFYYDNLVVSRGVLQPLTTLPAIALLVGLLILAWYWRKRRPVFSLGVLLFFAGHFATSNVVNLELAFEHRNHLPLIGVLLAVGDLFVAAVNRWRASTGLVVASVAVLATALGFFGALRAGIWGDPLQFAETTVEMAPDSVRARLLHCTTYYRLSGGDPKHPFFDLAIDNCEQGTHLQASAALLANLVTFRTINGTVSDDDWDRFLERTKTVVMSAENRGVMWVMMNNVERGIPMDGQRVLETILIVSNRAWLSARDSIRVGNFMLDFTSQPDAAYPYFVRAARLAPLDDPEIAYMLSDLAARGRDDWARELAELYAERRDTVNAQ